MTCYLPTSLCWLWRCSYLVAL